MTTPIEDKWRFNFRLRDTDIRDRELQAFIAMNVNAKNLSETSIIREMLYLGMQVMKKKEEKK